MGKKKKLIIIGIIALIFFTAMLAISNLFIILPVAYEKPMLMGHKDSPDGKHGMELINPHDNAKPKPNSYVLVRITQFRKPTKEDKEEFNFSETPFDSVETPYKDIYYDKGTVTDVTYDDIEWIDNETVRIKDRVMNIHHSVYDYRIRFWK